MVINPQDMCSIFNLSDTTVRCWLLRAVSESPAWRRDTKILGLGQAHVFGNLIQNLPARAARKKFEKIACLRAVVQKTYCRGKLCYGSTWCDAPRTHNAPRQTKYQCKTQSELRKATARATSLAEARIGHCCG